MQLRVGDASMTIGSTKVRALLQRLVTNRDRPISTGAIIRSLWGPHPPRTADHAVQVHLSKLRSLIRDAGGELPVEALPGAYRITSNHLVDVDTYAFEQDLADGRAALVGGDPQLAADLLDRARGRWRGTPFPDLADDVVADPEICVERHRLVDLRVDAEEEWAEACLALGRHHELVPELEAAVHEAPLRERRHQQLMVALYAAGRTSEALDVYQRARRHLIEELGIEPGPLLRDTEAAILNHDLAQMPGVIGRIIPTSFAPPDRDRQRFVGRHAERARLSDAAARAAVGRGSIVLVGGPPGIGKTRLVSEVAVATGPLLVATGASPETGAAPPLWPLLEALRTLGPAHLPPVGSGLDDEVLAPLRAAVTGITAPTIALPAAQGDDGAFRLRDAVAELLLRISRRTPLLLVLDDLHTADATTMGVLVHLADRIGEAPLAVLVTHRDTVGDHSPAFAASLGALVRSPGVQTVTLGPLDAGDVAGYLDAVGLPAHELAVRLHERCDGSPLFLTELIGLLLDHDGDTAVLDRIPASLSAVLDARLDRLGPARPVIERAAVIGPMFTIDLLARIADAGTDLLLDAVDTAVRFGIVDEISPDRYRFRHGLLAEAALAGVSASERARLHVRTAEAIERSSTAGRLDASMSITEAARHRIAALPAGDPTAAATACLAAAELANAAMADTDTIGFASAARRALELGARDEPMMRARSMVLEGEARTMRGEDARDLLDSAVEAARRTGDPELFGHAVRVRSLARSTAATAGATEVVTLLEEAITGLGDRGDHLATQLSVDLAMTIYRTPVHPRPREICETALARARVDGDPVSVAFALTGLHQAIWESRTARRRYEIADEAMTAASTAGLAWHESMATSFRAVDRWELGDVEGAAADFDHALTLAHRGRRARFIWIARSWQALLAVHRGDRGAAEQCRAEALGAWGEEPNPDATLCDLAHGMMGSLLDETAEGLDEVAAIARFQTDVDAEPLFWQSLLALALAVRGTDEAVEESRAAIDTVLASGLDALLPTVTRLPTLVLLAEAAARVGHAAAARAVQPMLEPEAGSHVLLNVYGGGGLYWGVVDQALAMAAAGAGDIAAAAQWQRSAEERLIATGGVTFLERSRRLARLLGIP